MENFRHGDDSFVVWIQIRFLPRDEESALPGFSIFGQREQVIGCGLNLAGDSGLLDCEFAGTTVAIGKERDGSDHQEGDSQHRGGRQARKVFVFLFHVSSQPEDSRRPETIVPFAITRLTRGFDLSKSPLESQNGGFEEVITHHGQGQAEREGH